MATIGDFQGTLLDFNVQYQHVFRSKWRMSSGFILNYSNSYTSALTLFPVAEIAYKF